MYRLLDYINPYLFAYQKRKRTQPVGSSNIRWTVGLLYYGGDKSKRMFINCINFLGFANSKKLFSFFFWEETIGNINSKILNYNLTKILSMADQNSRLYHNQNIIFMVISPTDH